MRLDASDQAGACCKELFVGHFLPHYALDHLPDASYVQSTSNFLLVLTQYLTGPSKTRPPSKTIIHSQDDIAKHVALHFLSSLGVHLL